MPNFWFWSFTYFCLCINAHWAILFFPFCFLIWESPGIVKVRINLMFILSWILLYIIAWFRMLRDCDWLFLLWCQRHSVNEWLTVIYLQYVLHLYIFSSCLKALLCGLSALRSEAWMSLWTACKTYTVLGWHLYLLFLFYLIFHSGWIIINIHSKYFLHTWRKTSRCIPRIFMRCIGAILHRNDVHRH